MGAAASVFAHNKEKCAQLHSTLASQPFSCSNVDDGVAPLLAQEHRFKTGIDLAYESTIKNYQGDAMTNNKSTNENTLRVADLMTRNAVFVNETDSLSSAMEAMNEHSLSLLPVVNDKQQVCGVLSVDDLMPLAYMLQCDVAVLQVVSDTVRKTLTDVLAQDNNDHKVNEFMTCSVETVSPDDSIQKASQQMVENSIHHLPVLDSDNRVVGILSSMDVVRSVAFQIHQGSASSLN